MRANLHRGVRQAKIGQPQNTFAQPLKKPGPVPLSSGDHTLLARFQHMTTHMNGSMHNQSAPAIRQDCQRAFVRQQSVASWQITQATMTKCAAAHGKWRS